MSTATMTREGKGTIPKKMRDGLGLKGMTDFIFGCCLTAR
jgi:bifunctional DNA-binding transcriptional regulator/antitoxin component of YhaV-PrlF toxin-antitoxin module